MTNVLKRFVKEAIFREKRSYYKAIYRLEDGKYYGAIIEEYDLAAAKRCFKKNCGLMADSWREIKEPGDFIERMVDSNDQLWVFHYGDI